MKAMLYRHHGGPEVLELADVADPEPGRRDVVVEVAACALNRLDLLQRAGVFTIPDFSLPHIAGMDLSGVVVQVGADVESVEVGARVVVDPSLAEVPAGSRLAGRGDLYGALGVLGANADGGYAERCLVPETHVHPVPDEVTLEDAAAFPTAYMTAWHALFETGRLRAGETVLVHAAGSGVSVAAIALAKAAGATVLATAGSAAKLERALALGADHVANNRTDDVAGFARDVTGGRGVDMVLDHVGTALFEPSVFALGVRGRLVCCGNTSGDTGTIPSLGYLYHFGISVLGSDPYRHAEFRPAWDLFCEKRLPAVIDSTYALADAGAAQTRLESGDTFGKVLLRR